MTGLKATAKIDTTPSDRITSVPEERGSIVNVVKETSGWKKISSILNFDR